MEVSIHDEINQLEMGKPHLVILGAGASVAALPRGDKNGKKLPLMNNFIETLHLEDLLAASGIKFINNNFEEIYSIIHGLSRYKDLLNELETRVHAYFSSMELPDYPTLYDHLVLSLRDKDVIATFNWDPFLVQAIRRNGIHLKSPKTLFLHGNVEVGYCPNGHSMGNNGHLCGICKTPFTPSKLLYPVAEKNYATDPFISRQWQTLEDVLKQAFMVSIFGYGAPTSDAKALIILKNSWGLPSERHMEEIEVIDIRPKDALRDTWNEFIHSHHYSIENDFYESWIANHPRRTGEAYLNQFVYAKFIDNNSLPRQVGFEDLWQWFGLLNAVEIDGKVQ